MRFSADLFKNRFTSLTLSPTAKKLLPSEKCLISTTYCLKNTLNKNEPRVETCLLQIKYFPSNRKKTSLLFFAYNLIKNPGVNSKKIYLGDMHVI